MAASEALVNVLFYVFALTALAGAAGVAASRNIVRSAFALLAVLFSAAALYAIMKADFIAAAQVLIYVGGILVLIIFAVMLTHRITDVNISNESTPGPAAFCAVLCLLFALVVIILPLPQPGTNKWDAGRGALVETREGGYAISQYQADSRTGLARGGSTFEDVVMIAIVVPPEKRGKAVRVEVQRVPAEKPAEKAAEKHDDKAAPAPAAKGPEKLGEADVTDETTWVRLAGLKEGPLRWQAKFFGPEAEGMPVLSLRGAGDDCVVYKGITEPIAWALGKPYLLAFEAVSVLLLAALVGAAFLARKEVRE